MTIKKEAELASALKNQDDTIEIEGDLANKVVRIKATGKVAWAVAFTGIAAAVVIFLATGGAGSPVSGIIGAGTITVLGLPAAASAVMIAVAAGGVGVLNTLRAYRISSKRDGHVVLQRK